MKRSRGGARRGSGVKGLGGRPHHRKGRHCDCRGKDLLVLFRVSFEHLQIKWSSHLLKLVTGVDISTRAVNKSGRPGKPVNRRSRTAAAAPNRVAFLLSMLIVIFKNSRTISITQSPRRRLVSLSRPRCLQELRLARVPIQFTAI
jgi:hypothetical protein